MKKQFVFLILIFIAVTPVISHAVRNNTAESDSLVFRRNCGKCHSIERPLGIEKTSLGWEKTVDWMQKKHDSFSVAEGKIIKRHLKKINSPYQKKIFEIKCAACHPLNVIFHQKRSPKEWNNLVKREQQKAITWISIDEAQDIASYLGSYYGNKGTVSNAMAKKKELTEKKCLLCHLYSTVFGIQRAPQQWRAINQRMRYKCPQWISQKEEEEITQFLIEAVPSGKWSPPG